MLFIEPKFLFLYNIIKNKCFLKGMSSGMKKIKNSKYLFMLILSFLALVFAIVEYIVILHATKYCTIPMLIAVASYIGLFIYAFVFKKKQTKFNLLIIVFIVIWLITFFFMGRGISNVGSRLKQSYFDRISILEFRFPGILEDVSYNKINGAIGTVAYREFKGLDLNLIVSIFMVLLSFISLLFKRKQESSDMIEEYQPANKITKSPYLLMVIVSFVGVLLSSIDCILSPSNSIIVMIIGSIIFIGLFLYILFSKKRFTLYNFLIVAFIVLWVGYTIELLFVGLGQTNNGKLFYRLEFIFPCIINKSSFDFPTGVKLSTSFELIYINWLFSIAMLLTTSFVLFFKEKKSFLNK